MESQNPGIWTLETITPQIASNYLKTMKGNRKLRKSRVEKIASNMSNGHFPLTHQGIAFNPEKVLTDGQHRLYAVIHSGCTVRMWVYRGLPDKSGLFVDVHCPRTDSDGLNYIHTETTAKVVSVLKRMLRGFGKQPVDYEQDRELLKQAHEKYLPSIEFAIDALDADVKRKGIAHSSTVAVVARAWYTQDRERLSSFCQILLDGVTENRMEDSAAIRLRDWLMLQPPNVSGGHAVVVYMKVESALLAFLEKRPLSKIYESSTERFPIPPVDNFQEEI